MTNKRKIRVRTVANKLGKSHRGAANALDASKPHDLTQNPTSQIKVDYHLTCWLCSYENLYTKNAPPALYYFDWAKNSWEPTPLIRPYAEFHEFGELCAGPENTITATIHSKDERSAKIKDALARIPETGMNTSQVSALATISGLLEQEETVCLFACEGWINEVFDQQDSSRALTTKTPYQPKKRHKWHLFDPIKELEGYSHPATDAVKYPETAEQVAAAIRAEKPRFTFRWRSTRCFVWLISGSTRTDGSAKMRCVSHDGYHAGSEEDKHTIDEVWRKVPPTQGLYPLLSAWLNPKHFSSHGL